VTGEDLRTSQQATFLANFSPGCLHEGEGMSSIYPVGDDDEVRFYKKDRAGNYYEIGDQEEIADQDDN